MLYSKHEKSYEYLLFINDDISIHQNHLHFLAPEIFSKSSIFNSINNLNPQVMWNCFSFKPILYELSKGNVIHFPPVPPTWQEIKVACRVRVAYLKEQNHQFFTVFLHKILKHVFNIILKLNNHT